LVNHDTYYQSFFSPYYLREKDGKPLVNRNILCHGNIILNHHPRQRIISAVLILF